MSFHAETGKFLLEILNENSSMISAKLELDETTNKSFFVILSADII